MIQKKQSTQSDQCHQSNQERETESRSKVLCSPTTCQNPTSLRYGKLPHLRAVGAVKNETTDACKHHVVEKHETVIASKRGERD